MENLGISKESYKFALLMYKYYLEQREKGASASDASSLGDYTFIKASIAPEMSDDDINYHCRVLMNAGLLNGSFADDCFNEGEILNPLIFHMETRFKRNLRDLLNFITNII